MISVDPEASSYTATDASGTDTGGGSDRVAHGAGSRVRGASLVRRRKLVGPPGGFPRYRYGGYVTDSVHGGAPSEEA